MGARELMEQPFDSRERERESNSRAKILIHNIHKIIIISGDYSRIPIYIQIKMKKV